MTTLRGALDRIAGYAYGGWIPHVQHMKEVARSALRAAPVKP